MTDIMAARSQMAVVMRPEPIRAILTYLELACR
jgi:hypothetical protein